jgi:hypothetical protein
MAKPVPTALTGRGTPGDCERALLSAPFPAPGRDVVEGQGH